MSSFVPTIGLAKRNPAGLPKPRAGRTTKRSVKATAPRTPEVHTIRQAWVRIAIDARTLLADACWAMKTDITARIAAGVTGDERHQLRLLEELAEQQVADADERVIEALVAFHGVAEDLGQLGYSDLPQVLKDAGNPAYRFEHDGKTYSVFGPNLKGEIHLMTS